MTNTCVIIEDNPLVAEDIAATLQECLRGCERHIFGSFDQARRALSQAGAHLVVVMSGGAAQLAQLDAGDLDLLERLAVVWIDTAPVREVTGPRWAIVAKPFTQEMLEQAVHTFGIALARP